MNKVFVDTDVILDLFIRREPHHSEALRLFTHLKRSKTKTCTSPIVVANTYYILATLKDKRYAIDRIKKLRALITIAAVDETMIDAALAAPYKDFEDSIQLQCAKMNEVDTIITRNTKDYPKVGITIANPGEYLQVETMGKEG